MLFGCCLLRKKAVDNAVLSLFVFSVSLCFLILPSTFLYAASAADESASHQSQSAHVYIRNSPGVLPRFAVQGPDALQLSQHKPRAATFHVYSNYSQFIDRWTLKVYRKSDTAHKSPVVEYSATDMLVRSVEWDGYPADGRPWSDGEQLYYQLEVSEVQGARDITVLKGLRVEAEDPAEQDRLPTLDQPTVVEQKPLYLLLSRREDARTCEILLHGSLCRYFIGWAQGREGGSFRISQITGMSII